MRSAKINSIVRLRINSDGKGVRSTVFLQDCPLKCKWCCNPETRFGDGFCSVTPHQLYELIEKDMIYFHATEGGITFSGGEPLLQAEFIKDFLQLHGEKFSTNIETSLFANKEAVEMLIPYIHQWYVDFKHFDDDTHKRYTGVSNKAIKENISLLSDAVDRENIIITFPIIPCINDSCENIANMIAFMKENGLRKTELHPYRKNCEKKYKQLGISYEEIPQLADASFMRIISQFEKSGIEILCNTPTTDKDKCELLKGIRQQYCKSNRIPLSFENCTFKGKCKGTCPKCEEELDIINHWINNNSD